MTKTDAELERFKEIRESVEFFKNNDDAGFYESDLAFILE